MVDWLVAAITVWFSVEFAFFGYRYAKLKPTTYSVNATGARVALLGIALWFLLMRLLAGAWY